MKQRWKSVMRTVAIVAVALGAVTAIWLVANRRVRGHKHRRVRAEDVLSLAEERDPVNREQAPSLRMARASRSDVGAGS